MLVLGHPTGYGKDSKEFSILRYAKGSPRRESFTGKLKGKQTERKADKKESRLKGKQTKRKSNKWKGLRSTQKY